MQPHSLSRIYFGPSPTIIFETSLSVQKFQPFLQAFMKLMFHLRPKMRRILFGLALALLVWKLWPVSQIEQISDELAGSAKTRRRGQGDGEKDVYMPVDKPLKGMFNPENGRIEIPQIIKPEIIDAALVKIGIRPMTKKVETRVPDQPKLKCKPTKFTGYTGLSLDTESAADCSQLKYEPVEQRQPENSASQRLDDKTVLSDLLQFLKSSEYASQIPGLDQMKVYSTDWRVYSGSAVWLPEEDAYMMVSRVAYTPKGKPQASFLRVQLFDKTWNEVKGRRIRYSNLSEKEVDLVLREYSFLKKDSVLDAISFKTPAFLNIKFEVGTKKWLKKSAGSIGPEDPRTIYRTTDKKGGGEPVILFDMLSVSQRRSMYAAFPFRKPTEDGFVQTLQFIHSGSSSLTIQSVEKNWTPFFEEGNRNTIGIIYSIDPLVVFRCQLDSGKCDKVQDNGSGSFSGPVTLKGGTNLFPIPANMVRRLPELQRNQGHNVQIWGGFAKMDNKQCGCGLGMARPVLYTFVEVDGTYRIDLVTTPIDFGINVQSYDGKGHGCSDSGPSVLTPNSIAYWAVTADIPSKETPPTQTLPNPSYHDFMAVTLSEADRTNNLVFLHNVASYILGIYEEGTGRTILMSEDSIGRTTTEAAEKCAVSMIGDYCQKLSGAK